MLIMTAVAVKDINNRGMSLIKYLMSTEFSNY